ncbi:MAG TPA: acyl carrier protein [Firmicutes bacterium]|nr:acyl carrier protein [Bacillota bacterium]
MSNHEEKVKELIADKLHVEPGQITPEARFIEDLGADSLDTYELIMALEEEYQIKISDEEAQKLTTVGSVFTYLKDKI